MKFLHLLLKRKLIANKSLFIIIITSGRMDPVDLDKQIEEAKTKVTSAYNEIMDTIALGICSICSSSNFR